MTGCTVRWMYRPFRLMAMLTESTRKGMSSLTICTMVCSDVQPSVCGSGLNTLIRGVPGLRTAAIARWPMADPARFSWLWAFRSSRPMFR